MAEIIKSGDVGLLSGKVAVLGFGSQGHAHALNLSDSGVEVEVGLRPDSSSRAAAEDAGLSVKTPAEAVRGAQLVAFLVPDGAQPASPSIAGSPPPDYAGSVVVTFDRPVTSASFDGGYFDSLESTEVVFIGTDGSTLFDTFNH